MLHGIILILLIFWIAHIPFFLITGAGVGFFPSNSLFLLYLSVFFFSWQQTALFFGVNCDPRIKTGCVCFALFVQHQKYCLVACLRLMSIYRLQDGQRCLLSTFHFVIHAYRSNFRTNPFFFEMVEKNIF